MAETDPHFQNQAFCNFLSELPALEEFDLDITGSKPVQAQSLFARLNAPGERPLHYAVSDVVAAQPGHLTVLRLRSHHVPLWSGVWRTLRSARVKLADITTSVVTPELFDYLTSYSGLRKLVLEYKDGGSREANDGIADAFYNSGTLVQHADSLLELYCPAGRYESRFGFGVHNAQNLLLETTANLPNLRSLTISAADAQKNRGVWCGNGAINHTMAVVLAIKRTVDKAALGPAVVRVGYTVYELQFDEGRIGREAEV
ncbi:hypothetical protein FB45DRAFT_1024365 [Roridomyces roridus]|uniref:Uncharacterized protein n=1 Tax=Roridomyces roridus TaxID=1738132 RepID=A0AAD7FPH3_9AGAR|nr:hypothetical protein FB45DRAFT_1024365 [Roridomyces roridus]